MSDALARARAQLERTGSERLCAHLERTYGIAVSGTAELDLGVLRVERAEGPPWLARVFAAARPLTAVEGDAEILRQLEQRGFPAERTAAVEPVSVHEGQPVLVTEFLAGERPHGGRAFAILGALLGALHSHPATGLRDGGAWHHLTPAGGSPRSELNDLAALMAEVGERASASERGLHARLRAEVEALDDCSELPHAFVHPDFVPVNAVATAEGRLAIVDWAGAGRGPRLWSLAPLLWSAGAASPRLLELVLSRYRRHVELEDAERAALADALRARPLVLDCWSYCLGRRPLRAVVGRLEERHALARAIAAQAHAALA